MSFFVNDEKEKSGKSKLFTGNDWGDERESSSLESERQFAPKDCSTVMLSK